MTYTQRDWDRTVGWGKVPKEYERENNNDGEKQERNRTPTRERADQKRDEKTTD